MLAQAIVDGEGEETQTERRCDLENQEEIMALVLLLNTQTQIAEDRGLSLHTKVKIAKYRSSPIRRVMNKEV